MGRAIAQSIATDSDGDGDTGETVSPTEIAAGNAIAALKRGNAKDFAASIKELVAMSD